MKRYDGHLLVDFKHQVEEKFRGLTLVGDQHFHWASGHFEHVRVIAPVSAQTGRLEECPSLRNTNKRKRVLSFEEVQRNEAIRNIRGRSETPFSTCKRLFRCLREKFPEADERQHDCLVRTGFAFHNLHKR